MILETLRAEKLNKYRQRRETLKRSFLDGKYLATGLAFCVRLPNVLYTSFIPYSITITRSKIRV